MRDRELRAGQGLETVNGLVQQVDRRGVLVPDDMHCRQIHRSLMDLVRLAARRLQVLQGLSAHRESLVRIAFVLQDVRHVPADDALELQGVAHRLGDVQGSCEMVEGLGERLLVGQHLPQFVMGLALNRLSFALSVEGRALVLGECQCPRERADRCVQAICLPQAKAQVEHAHKHVPTLFLQERVGVSSFLVVRDGLRVVLGVAEFIRPLEGTQRALAQIRFGMGGVSLVHGCSVSVVRSGTRRRRARRWCRALVRRRRAPVPVGATCT